MMNPTDSSIRPPETVFLCLYPDTSKGQREQSLEIIRSVLPYINWRSDVYIIDGGAAGRTQRAAAVIQVIAEFLTQNTVSAISVHPFISMSGMASEETRQWQDLLGLMRPFQREAYDHQSEVRMMILPIIEPQGELAPDVLVAAAEFFDARMAKPAFLFSKASRINTETVLEKGLRIYIDSENASGEGRISVMKRNHVFDSVLGALDSGTGGLIDPCRRHLVIDERSVGVYPCFTLWETGQRVDSLQRVDVLPENMDCYECVSRSCLDMKLELAANGREEEGRQVNLGLAIALSRKGKYQNAAINAQCSFELAGSDADRATALLNQGLCHLNLMELSKADRLLDLGSAYTSDPGVFAYHRGRVQFALQNYREAIERFSECLSAKSEEVDVDDILFNLAISYINLDIFDRARYYLSRMERKSAPVEFYLGICDLGEGAAERALERFRGALSIGPAPEDVSRILFYTGNCYKELGRYDDAMLELKKATRADPDDYMNYNLLGFCLFKVGRYEEAIAALYRAIEINPGSAIDYASLGSNLRELGRIEEAIAMYRMALSIDPTLSFAMENVARLSRMLEE